MSSTQKGRENESLLHKLEHRLLQALVRRLPNFVTSDLLTALGLVGAVTAGVGYILSGWHDAFLWLASFGLIVNWFGDSLDGTLARYRKIERPIYGFYVDHTTDIIAVISIMLGMGLSPYARLDVLLLLIIAYLAIACVAFIRRCATGTLTISFYGNGPTEMRLAGVAMNTSLYCFHQPVFNTRLGTVSLLDVVLFGVAFGSLCLLLLTIFREGRELASQDPLTK